MPPERRWHDDCLKENRKNEDPLNKRVTQVVTAGGRPDERKGRCVMVTVGLTELLAKIPFSADLPDEMLRNLCCVSHIRSFQRGDILFEQGTRNTELFLIWSGAVALDMNVPGQGNQRILNLGPGDLVAWSALLDAGLMTTSAVALDDTVVVAIPGDRLRAECEKDPALGYQIMRRVSEQLAARLTATRRQLLALAQPKGSCQKTCGG